MRLRIIIIPKGVRQMSKKENEDKRVLLDFYSAGCAPCRRMEPVIREFAEASDLVEVRRIEASEAPDAFENYGITSVPTFIYMKGGKEKGRIAGVCDRKDIERLVSEG